MFQMIAWTLIRLMLTGVFMPVRLSRFPNIQDEYMLRQTYY